MKKLKAVFFIVLCAIWGCIIPDASAASVKDLMANAFKPVGKCLYVYGGGWNEADTAAGTEALSYGISPTWEEFFNKNNSSYNHKKARYMIHNGLDCTGYVGWNMYQLFGTSYNESGYVYHARRMTQKYTEIFGGSFTGAGSVNDYECGDIMSNREHAYIVVGQCDDKSVVLLHSSPPAVSLCGTSTPSGKSDSQAVRLAKSYMSTYFPSVYGRYDTCHRGTSYLTSYNRMRWNSEVLTDSDGYRNMKVEDILWDLFVNVKLYINGERVHFSKEPFIENGVTYIPCEEACERMSGALDESRSSKLAEYGEFMPVRAFANLFNMSAEWDGESKSVYLKSLDYLQ